MIVVESESLRRISSSSKSETVLPSSTLPTRLVAPVKYSRASPSEVFPAAAVGNQGDVADGFGCDIPSWEREPPSEVGRASRL